MVRLRGRLGLCHSCDDGCVPLALPVQQLFRQQLEFTGRASGTLTQVRQSKAILGEYEKSWVGDFAISCWLMVVRLGTSVGGWFVGAEVVLSWKKMVSTTVLAGDQHGHVCASAFSRGGW